MKHNAYERGKEFDLNYYYSSEERWSDQDECDENWSYAIESSG